MKRIEAFFRELLEPGTPQFGFFCGVVGAILAFLFLGLGFWKTLFVCAFCAGGAFLGGVKEKADFCKALINKLFPPREG